PAPVFVPTPPPPDPRPPPPEPAFVPQPFVQQQPAFYGAPPGAGPYLSHEEPAARKSRAGLVVALTLGILAVAGVVAAVAFRQEIFGDEARTAAGEAEAGSADAATAAPARIGAMLAFSPDGSDVRLVFGAIESERPVREILLAVGPAAGTSAAVVRPGKEAPVADLLPAGGSLAPGTLKVPLDVVYVDGAVERVEAALAVPYTFRASVKDGGTVPVLRIEFRVVPGTTLEAAGASVEVSADGSAAYEIPVENLRDREGAWKESENHVDVSVAFAAIGPGGERAEGAAALQVPIAKLRVDFPPLEALTTEATVWVRGETALDAALALDGAPISVNPNGTFAVEVPLVEGATPRAITLAARRPGSLERRATVTVTRLAPEDLLARAREYEAGIADRLGYSDFAAAASSFVGRRVRLKGTVRSTPEMRGGTVTFVLFVDTASGCPRRAVCAVLVQAATAVPIAERSVVRVLGEIAGVRVTTSAEFPELPAVRAEFVLPGG
ncbi:MAG: hypothetical protein QME96_13840, partial [Myxococcota bacterium]|nr:hypothetical protein [Myxococcota bacterium]